MASTGHSTQTSALLLLAAWTTPPTSWKTPHCSGLILYGLNVLPDASSAPSLYHIQSPPLLYLQLSRTQSCPASVLLPSVLLPQLGAPWGQWVCAVGLWRPALHSDQVQNGYQQRVTHLSHVIGLQLYAKPWAHVEKYTEGGDSISF